MIIIESKRKKAATILKRYPDGMTGTWYVSSVIRTKTEYQHGLLLTKPLHHSQKETQTFGEHDGLWYGEVTLTIEPNRELRGRILMYGEGLEVVDPLTLREQIREVIKRQMAQYTEE